MLKVTLAHKVSPKSTDPGHLYSLYSYLQNLNTVLVDSRLGPTLLYCPEALCLHSAGSYTDCTNELDL